MASHDIRAAVTDNSVSQQRSQRSRSPRVFPRLNAEPLAEPIDVDSESSSDGTAYLDSDVDSMGDGIGFPPEFTPQAATTVTGSASGTAIETTMVRVSYASSSESCASSLESNEADETQVQIAKRTAYMERWAMHIAEMATRNVAEKLKDEDPPKDRLAKRKNSIEIIKAKEYYQQYLAAVPVHLRRPTDPQTPRYDAEEVSTRKFRYKLSRWDKEVKHIVAYLL